MSKSRFTCSIDHQDITLPRSLVILIPRERTADVSGIRVEGLNDYPEFLIRYLNQAIWKCSHSGGMATLWSDQLGAKRQVDIPQLNALPRNVLHMRNISSESHHYDACLTCSPILAISNITSRRNYFHIY